MNRPLGVTIVAMFREDRNKIRYYLENLQNVYERCEIGEDSYKELKEKYERELKSIEERIAELTLEIERRKTECRKGIEKLEFERTTTLRLLDDVESKHRSGEIDEETYRKRKSEIEDRLRDLERRINETNDLIRRLESI